MNIPFFGRKAQGEQTSIVSKAQIRDSWDTPYAAYFGDYIPLTANLDFYDIIREAIPLFDVMVSKRVNLIGDFRLDGEGNQTVQDFLDWFYQNVQVGYLSRGYMVWLRQLIDSTISKGFGIGELVPNSTIEGVYCLKIGKANNFRFKPAGKELEIVQVIEGQMKPIKLENQDLLYYLAFDLRDGHPQGVSMFKSFPFVSDIITRILTSVRNSIWRIGDPTFYALYQAPAGEKGSATSSAVTGITGDLTSVNKDRKRGMVRDIAFGYGNGGSLEIKTLGADNKPYSVEVPLRFCEELAVAKSGLAPFMYGLSWSTTERMSKQQADMVVADIESERTILDSIITKTIDLALILNGFAGAKWHHEWNPVNLMDETEQANARFTNAQALEKEIQALLILRDSGLQVEDALINLAITNGFIEDEKQSREAMIKEIERKANFKEQVVMAKMFIEAPE